MNQMHNIAIIGCGAVTEQLHLPALVNSDKVNVNVLVDINERRLNNAGSKYNVSHLSTNIDEIDKHADYVILAVPHHLHTPLAISLIEKGLNVFLEKPLATNLSDANLIIKTAETNNRKVGVGLIRRLYSTSGFVKEVIDNGWLGDIISFDVKEGGVYNWPAKTDTLFKKETGGGVLFDTGAHTLDMVTWLLGQFNSVEYWDDSFDGVDANCLIKLKMKNGAKGVVELSRTRNLRNTFIIKGTKGELEFGLGPNSDVKVKTAHFELTNTPGSKLSVNESFLDIGRRQIESFIDSCDSGDDPPVSAKDTLESVRIFDECKRNVQRFEHEWTDFKPNFDFSRFDNKTILVLGGTGFIGGRLVEVLKRNTSAHIKVLVRDFSKLSNIARFNLEFLHGDVTNKEALSKAVEGSNIIFNSTYGKGNADIQKQVNVDAVKFMIEEVAKHNVERVVHVSTLSVYGDKMSGTIDESSPKTPPKDDIYGVTKLEGEEVAIEYSNKLNVPISIVQPTIVYGPNAPTWTVGPISRLKSGKVILPENVDGLCNAVYVDDVVNAILLAATEKKAIGQICIISGDKPVTWFEFYNAYQNILGVNSITRMSVDEIKEKTSSPSKATSKTTLGQIIVIIRTNPRVRNRLLQFPFMNRCYRLVKFIIPVKIWESMKKKFIADEVYLPKIAANKDKCYYPNESLLNLYTSKVSVNIDKAKRILNYSPLYDLNKGMEITGKWIKWWTD